MRSLQRNNFVSNCNSNLNSDNEFNAGQINRFKNFIEYFKKAKIKEQYTYNIFDTCSISCQEILVCRFLGSLLDPKGEHGMGDIFLKSFLNLIFNGLPENPLNKLKETFLSKFNVYLEYTHQKLNKRRIDILLDLDGFYIPIEVKIYARDGDNQCCDYFKFCASHNVNNSSVIVYLTLNGTKPDEKSIGNVDGDQLICLSFKNDIYNWLDSTVCSLKSDVQNTNNKNDVNLIKINRVCSVVEQFLDAIKNITGRLEMEEIEQYVELNKNEEIVKSSDDFIAAKRFAENFYTAVKIRKLQDFFASLNASLHEKLDAVGADIVYDRNVILAEAEKMYLEDKSGYPSIVIKLPSDDFTGCRKAENYSLELAVEASDVISIGYSMDHQGNGIPGGKALMEYVNNHICDSYKNELASFQKGDYWFADRNYMIGKASPDFINCNSSYSKLYDHDVFKNTVDNISDELFHMYMHWINPKEH